MTKEQFAILAKGMKSAYPGQNFLPDSDSMDVWYGFLGHLEYNATSKAVTRHIMTSKFPPTIKDILDYVTEDEGESEALAWDSVRKAIRNGIYGAESEFEALSDTVKEAVGSPSSLTEWAMIPSDEVETVIQSQFLRRFRTIQERRRADKITAPLLGNKEQEKIGGRV